jgi:geranylgeranyl transferase type-1 subunit beta
MRFEAGKHSRFLFSCLDMLPPPYASLDTNRLTLAFFCVSGLDVLGDLARVDARRVISWVYSLQVLPPAEDGHHLSPERCGGFRGCGFLGAPYSSDGSQSTSEYDGAHLAMTYTALAVLLILGDDLSRVRADGVLAFVASLQGADGCFCAYPGGESDMRFLFCAAAVVAMLRGGSVPPNSGVDVELATQYVLSSRAYDGGIGLAPGQESHGGSTCAKKEKRKK